MAIMLASFRFQFDIERIQYYIRFEGEVIGNRFCYRKWNRLCNEGNIRKFVSLFFFPCSYPMK